MVGVLATPNTYPTGGVRRGTPPKFHETRDNLHDEFPDGEQHYRIPLDRTEVVEAFTISVEGERTRLASTVTATREASFASRPQARTATASTARPSSPAAGKSGPELSR